MEYKKLGRTGLKVSRICQGTALFGSYVEQDICTRIFDACLEHGINFVDTADTYSDGKSEEFVGKAMKGRRHEFVLATKVENTVGPRVNDRGASRKHILEGVDASLRRLNTDYIDLYQIHHWDPETPLEETLRTLDDLVRQGKVRYIGCSNFDAWQLCKALWISDKLGLERFQSVQPLYNFTSKAIEAELLPLCLDQQISVNPWQVLMAGVLTGSYKRSGEAPQGTPMASSAATIPGGVRARYWKEEHFDLVDRLKEMAQQKKCTVTQLTLAWALANPAITTVLVGATSPEQVGPNTKAVEITLTPQEVETLDNL